MENWWIYKYDGDILPIYDAAMKYKEVNQDTIVL